MKIIITLSIDQEREILNYIKAHSGEKIDALTNDLMNKYSCSKYAINKLILKYWSTK